MSATSPTPKSLFDGLSAASTILTIVIAAGGTLLTSGAIYGGLVGRLGRVEQTVTENKSERERALDDLKANMVGKERYESDMKAVERIERTVQEIRRDQIEDLKRRAEAGNAPENRRER